MKKSMNNSGICYFLQTKDSTNYMDTLTRELWLCCNGGVNLNLSCSPILEPLKKEKLTKKPNKNVKKEKKKRELEENRKRKNGKKRRKETRDRERLKRK